MIAFLSTVGIIALIAGGVKRKIVQTTQFVYVFARQPQNSQAKVILRDAQPKAVSTEPMAQPKAIDAE